MQVVPKDFYLGRDTATIARDLLGKVLVSATEAGLTSGVIVETEAYLGGSDPASHAFRGPTRRNQAAYGPPGSSYVYISYGIHRCFDVVCQLEGTPETVLIRGLQPLEGIELMRSRRGSVTDKNLVNGPGKLCQALAIGLNLNGHPLQRSPLYMLDGKSPDKIIATPRIGISVGKELLLRFIVSSSVKSPLSPRLATEGGHSERT